MDDAQKLWEKYCLSYEVLNKGCQMISMHLQNNFWKEYTLALPSTRLEFCLLAADFFLSHDNLDESKTHLANGALALEEINKGDYPEKEVHDLAYRLEDLCLKVINRTNS